MSPKQNIIKISNQKSQAKLVLTANADSFALSLEGETAENPPSQSFEIEESSDVYLPFLNFFKTIAMIKKGNIIFDELVSIEHAPILLFSKKESGLVVRFAVETNFKNQVRHIPNGKNKRITDAYIKLFNDLMKLKIIKTNKSKKFNEMARS